MPNVNEELTVNEKRKIVKKYKDDPNLPEEIKDAIFAMEVAQREAQDLSVSSERELTRANAKYFKREDRVFDLLLKWIEEQKSKNKK